MEYYADQGWTDGLPVVPVTESYLASFLGVAGRDPDDVLLAAADSAVTAMVIRSCVHIEARHTMVPEQLAADLAGTIARTGRSSTRPSAPPWC